MCHISKSMPQAGIDPPSQSHASYETSALPLSHHGWIVIKEYRALESSKLRPIQLIDRTSFWQLLTFNCGGSTKTFMIREWVFFTKGLTFLTKQNKWFLQARCTLLFGGIQSLSVVTRLNYNIIDQ